MKSDQHTNLSSDIENLKSLCSGYACHSANAYTIYFEYRHSGSFSRKHVKYNEIERVDAYWKVLKTWSRWVEAHIDPKRTTVLFMSVSPVHMQ